MLYLRQLIIRSYNNLHIRPFNVCVLIITEIYLLFFLVNRINNPTLRTFVSDVWNAEPTFLWSSMKGPLYAISSFCIVLKMFILQFLILRVNIFENYLGKQEYGFIPCNLQNKYMYYLFSL